MTYSRRIDCVINRGPNDTRCPVRTTDSFAVENIANPVPIMPKTTIAAEAGDSETAVQNAASNGNATTTIKPKQEISDVGSNETVM